MLSSRDRTQVRVQLQPPELGTVRVELTADRTNAVEARIVAERDEVRQLIERNLPQLRESLSASGIDVSGFDVSTQDFTDTPHNDAGKAGDHSLARDDAEPEGDQPSTPSGPARGVNRSGSDDAVDYLI
jgi:flagellar hook-length control protein FliK